MNAEEYKPQPIPKRDPSMRTHSVHVSPDRQSALPWEQDFAEILLQSSPASDAALSQAQRIQPAPDEKRAVFSEMRQISRQDVSCIGNPSKVFYMQARLMEHFTDDYSEQVSFSFYYPYYQLMSYGQLRTYFTWRTQVRMGNIRETSVSYVFVYIYELLACIGADSPQDSLDKLVTFWRAYRALDRTIDKYVLQWMKDFHIYYPLRESFAEFAAREGLQEYYPRVFAYGCGRENSFALYSSFSKYDIRKSIFYTEKTRGIIGDCFYFLLTKLRKMCRDKKKVFEDFVFYPMRKETDWKPFAGALFHPCLEQEDRVVELSPREAYTCTRGRWTYHSVILTDGGRSLIGYIMKELESMLRERLHFRYKLHPSLDMCDGKILKRLRLMDISLPEVISQGVDAFLALRNRRVVRVDAASVYRIREESLETQDKLIVPEEAEPVEEIPAPVSFTPAAEVEGDAWQMFYTSLTETEVAALTAALNGQNVKAIADGQGMMLEVLLDGINEKAMDAIGDTVLEMDDTVVVYEEYREKLMELVGC